MIKLSDYARKNNISYMTAWRWWKQGLLDGKQVETGTILIKEQQEIEMTNIVYTRVSSSKNKDNLEGQVERVSQFCISRGYIIHEIVKEVGSGVNENRKKLNKILSRDKPIRIIVEHKDRLTRFGFTYIEKIVKQNGGEIIVVNEAEDETQDLIQDLVAIVYSFSAKLYNKRRAKKIKEIVEDAVS